MAENKKGRAEIRRSPDHIPAGEKLCYGVGAFMDGGGVALMGCVMLKYMTSALGIAMAVASTIITVGKVWDAITDPLMGFISDNTRGKLGRRKPYMFFGGIFLIIALFVLFMPLREWGVSIGGATAFMVVFYLFWNTATTVTQVPYCSMASDISPSFAERNNANTVKLVFSAVSAGLSYALPLLLIEALIDKDGYLFMPNVSPTTFWLVVAGLFGTLFGGGLIICSLKVKERIGPTGPREKFDARKFVNNYIEPYKNRSYRWHIGMYCAAFMCMDMISALAVYYATDVWHGRKLFGMDISSLFIVAPLMVSAAAMIPVGRIMMDKKSKQFVFRMGLPFYILGGIMFAVMDPAWTPPVLIPVVALFMGFGFGGAQMMPWMIFPDTLDVAELSTGKRPTGTYSGMMTLARKVAGALGVGMVGWIIGGVGYKENATGDATAHIQQTPEVLLAVRLVMGLAIAAFISVAMFCSFRYKITNEKLKRIRYFIDLNKNGLLDSATDAEKAERIELIATLAGRYDAEYDEKFVVRHSVAPAAGEIADPQGARD